MKPETPQQAFAYWLAENQPHVFVALVDAMKKEAKRQNGGVAGITDWLSNVGTTIGSATKSVGSFLTSQQGLATLSTVGGLYLQTQAQKDALKVQVAQMQAGNAPQPIYSAGANYNSSVPIYVDPTTGQRLPLSSSLATQLMPERFSGYLPMFLIGAGIFMFAFYFLSSPPSKRA